MLSFYVLKGRPYPREGLNGKSEIDCIIKFRYHTLAVIKQHNNFYFQGVLEHLIYLLILTVDVKRDNSAT